MAEVRFPGSARSKSGSRTAVHGATGVHGAIRFERPNTRWRSGVFPGIARAAPSMADDTRLATGPARRAKRLGIGLVSVRRILDSSRVGAGLHWGRNRLTSIRRIQDSVVDPLRNHADCGVGFSGYDGGHYRGVNDLECRNASQPAIGIDGCIRRVAHGDGPDEMEDCRAPRLDFLEEHVIRDAFQLWAGSGLGCDHVGNGRAVATEIGLRIGSMALVESRMAHGPEMPDRQSNAGASVPSPSFDQENAVAWTGVQEIEENASSRARADDDVIPVPRPRVSCRRVPTVPFRCSAGSASGWVR